jgi:hypothetical protein
MIVLDALTALVGSFCGYVVVRGVLVIWMEASKKHASEKILSD